MSSNPRVDPPGVLTRIRSPRTWSLRARLLVTQVALLAVVCAGIGIATEFALQRFLMHQLDQQLTEAGRRSAAMFAFGPPPPPGFGPPRAPAGTPHSGRPRVTRGASSFVRTTDQGRRSSTLPARRPARSAPSSPGERPSRPASSPPTVHQPKSPPRQQRNSPGSRRIGIRRPSISMLSAGTAWWPITPKARRRRSWSACRPLMSTTRCCGSW